MSAMSLVNIIRKARGDDIAGAVDDLTRIAGFPEEVAQRIATGELPMDEASRVARRERTTHPETYYNGSKTGGLLEIDPDMSGSERGMSTETGFWGGGPERASGYAGNPVHDNSTVYPFRIKDNDDQMIVDGQGAAWNNIKPSAPVSVKHWGEGPTDYGSVSGWTDDYYDTNSLAHMAKDRIDFNSLVFKGIADAADNGNVWPELMDMFPELRKMPYGSEQRSDFLRNISKEDASEAYRRAEAKSHSTGTTVVAFDPDDIRSPNAAYDPQYNGPNIMGGAAGTAGLTGLLAAGQSDDSEASLARLAARGFDLVQDVQDPKSSDSLFTVVDDAGDYVATAHMDDAEVFPGALNALELEVLPAHRGKGIAGEMYDAIQEVTGQQVRPSPWLSRDGAEFWRKRDPDSLRYMVENDKFYDGQNHNQVQSILEEWGLLEPVNKVKLKGFERQY